MSDHHIYEMCSISAYECGKLEKSGFRRAFDFIIKKAVNSGLYLKLLTSEALFTNVMLMCLSLGALMILE